MLQKMLTFSGQAASHHNEGQQHANTCLEGANMNELPDQWHEVIGTILQRVSVLGVRAEFQELQVAKGECLYLIEDT